MHLERIWPYVLAPVYVTLVLIIAVAFIYDVSDMASAVGAMADVGPSSGGVVKMWRALLAAVVALSAVAILVTYPTTAPFHFERVVVVVSLYYAYAVIATNERLCDHVAAWVHVHGDGMRLFVRVAYNVAWLLVGTSGLVLIASGAPHASPRKGGRVRRTGIGVGFAAVALALLPVSLVLDSDHPALQGTTAVTGVVRVLALLLVYAGGSVLEAITRLTYYYRRVSKRGGSLGYEETIAYAEVVGWRALLAIGASLWTLFVSPLVLYVAAPIFVVVLYASVVSRWDEARTMYSVAEHSDADLPIGDTGVADTSRRKRNHRRGARYARPDAMSVKIESDSDGDDM